MNDKAAEGAMAAMTKERERFKEQLLIAQVLISPKARHLSRL